MSEAPRIAQVQLRCECCGASFMLLFSVIGDQLTLSQHTCGKPDLSCKVVHATLAAAFNPDGGEWPCHARRRKTE